MTNDPRSAVATINPEQAYRQGLPICQAVSASRKTTKLLLLAELGRLWRAVKVGDARTWTQQEDLQDTVDDILEIFPTMKVEEVLLVFKRIRQGEIPIYGRLDTPTVMEALRSHESAHTIPLREVTSREIHTAALDIAPHREGAMTIAEALGKIGREMRGRKKTLEELGGHLHLTQEELLNLDQCPSAKHDAQ